MCIANIGAAEVLLHHILVKPRHHDGNQRATNKLFEKIIGVGPATFKEKNLAHVILYDVSCQANEGRFKCITDEHDGQKNSKQHGYCLKRIGYYDGLEAAPEGIQPN